MVIELCCYRGLVSPTDEQCSPIHDLCGYRKFVRQKNRATLGGSPFLLYIFHFIKHLGT